ncbi:inverted formin-2-like [Colius striatus]|uniref:inverted formin-2-like n=1 Tax=Colius striatus TaxID=57412 RepID=UPI002B1D816E|nr:inverted formin-2-like [Colius striatus]
MKMFRWQKLPSDVVRQSHSMWAVVPSTSKELIEPDYASLELLFSLPPTPPKEKTRPKLKKTKEHLCLSYSSNEEIATMIQKGDRSKLDAETLKQLLKLLPKEHEGHHTGDAGGFKISALLRLTETKANQSHITLLHHILEEVGKHHTDLLQLPRDLEFVSKAAGIRFDVLRAEAGASLKKLLEIEKRLLLSPDDLKIQHGKSVQDSLSDLKDLQKEFATIERKKEELADYLCEDRNKMSLEDVFRTMKTFRELFLKALQENQERKEQATKSEKRKKQLKGEDAKRLKGEYGKRSNKN